MQKQGVFLLVCLSVLLGWSIWAYGEDRGPIYPAETRIGTLTSPGFQDTWNFDGVAGDRVIITAARITGSVHPDIELYPPSGGVECSDTGYAFTHRVDCQLKQTGTYTILITDNALQYAGDYGIALAKIPGQTTSLIDPDGGPIAPASTMTGTISNYADMDIYQFYGETGDRVVITAAKTSDSVHPDIYLYPPDQGVVEASATGYAFTHRLDCQLQQTGTYTIIINDNALQYDGGYGIALIKLPGPFTSTTDPDGGPIAPASTMTGTISNYADMDMYQFYGETGHRVVITAAKTSGSVHPDIYLYPPDQGVVEASATGYAFTHRLDYQLQQTGLYTIIINDNALQYDGGYGIALAKIPGPCTSLTDPDGGCPITSGADMTGTISSHADTDMYQFYGAIGDRVVITAARTSGSVHPDIYLYPPDHGDFEDSARGYASSNSLDHELLQTGLYTIMISDNALQYDGGFGMSLSKIPSTVRPGIYNPSPANGASISNLSGFFSWNAVSGATGYDLYFGENVTTALQKIGSNLSSPSRAFPALEFNKVYYWHVVAHTATGDVQGPYWWFMTPVSYLLWTR